MTVPPFGIWPPVVIPPPTPPGPPAPPTAADITAQISPSHWWRSDDVVESGGLVDSILDNGNGLSGNIPFAQVGAARAPTAIDADGKVYIAPDGVADFYVAGIIADWNFLHRGQPWTLALVYHRAALITADETVIDTTASTSANSGVLVRLAFSSASLQGPQCYVTRSVGGTGAIGVSHSFPNTEKTAFVIRHNGDEAPIVALGLLNTAQDMQLKRKGRIVATAPRTNAYNTGGNANNALNLFRNGGGAAFSSLRFYEMIIDNKAWSDRQTLMWEDYARSNYVLPSM